MSAGASESSKTPAGRAADAEARLRALGAAIENLQGVGPKRAAQLKDFGIATIRDLLYHLPFRYEDRRQIKKIAEAAPGETASFAGRLIGLQKKFVPRLRRRMLLGTLRDETASIDLIWYRAPGYLADSLTNGRELLVHGKVEPGMPGRLRIAHPDFDFIDSGAERERQRILPIYVCPAGIPPSLLRRWAAQALEAYRDSLSNGLPEAIVRRQGLLDAGEALTGLHCPDAGADIAALNACSSPAHRTIIFDELFYLQLGLGRRKISQRGYDGIRFALRSAGLVQRMKKLLPFDLTGAQRRVLGEIEGDLAGDRPMQRLVQGDVGSGKTLVAWLASLRAIESGYQALWLAPTEILAEQHYRNLKPFADELRIPAALLTAATAAKEKRDLLRAIERADVAFVVGTHALIQEEVRAPRMGLGVIDEQHRFGVVQRLSLRRLIGSAAARCEPHLLLMSATPIPRSLALVLYGDMEVSFVDELPPGRKPVRTRLFSERERKQVYAIVLEELKRGRQAFVVLPLVEASEQLQQVRDATQMAEKMRQTLFQDFGVGLVHGRLKTEERDAVMRDFRDGRLGILVATTVIEVGIDIPNATVMVVEHAERFGLSQLHQLRGRVGRGAAPGQCLLVDRGTGSALAAERLRVMVSEHDGFKIAEADLRLRGPGEMLGARQSGLGDFHFASLARDARVLAEARKEALAWLEKDPELKSKASAQMRRILRQRWGTTLQLGSVG